jgi:hypothetical protein
MQFMPGDNVRRINGKTSRKTKTEVISHHQGGLVLVKLPSGKGFAYKFYEPYELVKVTPLKGKA